MSNARSRIISLSGTLNSIFLPYLSLTEPILTPHFPDTADLTTAMALLHSRWPVRGMRLPAPAYLGITIGLKVPWFIHCLLVIGVSHSVTLPTDLARSFLDTIIYHHFQIECSQSDHVAIGYDISLWTHRNLYIVYKYEYPSYKTRHLMID